MPKPSRRAPSKTGLNAQGRPRRSGAKGGRPPYQPTPRDRRVVEALRVDGRTEEDIAALFKIDPKTLRAHFRDEIDNAKMRTDAAITNMILIRCMGGPNIPGVSEPNWEKASDTMLIWYTKTKMGWREPPREVAHSGAIGQYDLSKLSDDQLSHVRSILAPAVIGGGGSGAGAPEAGPGAPRAPGER